MWKIVATVTWEALCRLSVRMTNSDESQRRNFHPLLVYLHDNSAGGRTALSIYYVAGAFESLCGDGCHDPQLPHNLPEGCDEYHLCVEDGFGAWHGFYEANSLQFCWTSGTSGATIEAFKCSDGTWLLRFVGADPDYGHESTYLRDFALAAKPGSISIEQKGDPNKAAATLKDQLKWVQQELGDAAF